MRKLLIILLPLMTVILPVFLIMTSVRILINPFFLDYEYRQTSFPMDPYGFTTADRLNWGKLSLDYLVNDEGLEFLAELKFLDGTPLYNERELSHMVDVKQLVKSMVLVWYGFMLFILTCGLLSFKAKQLGRFWNAVSLGGWLGLGLIVLILGAVLIDFDGLFTGFHAIFFTTNTWLFYSTDTLIRLFPEKLWSDAFIFMGIFTFIGAALCAFLAGRQAHIEHKNAGF